ncbi:hypothetical protein D3C78_1741650 [compost metagenome]
MRSCCISIINCIKITIFINCKTPGAIELSNSSISIYRASSSCSGQYGCISESIYTENPVTTSFADVTVPQFINYNILWSIYTQIVI